MSIRKIFQIAAVPLVMAFALIVPVALGGDGSVANAAAPPSVTDGVNSATPTGTSTSLPVLIKRIVNILLFVVGIASVIIIIIGGLRYVTSAGDQAAIKGAKETILYAVVGLVVATMAFAIVNFVTSKI